MSANSAPEDLIESLEVEGFTQVVIDHWQSAPNTRLLVIQSSQGDKYETLFVAVSQHRRQIVAVESRHADIKEDDVGVVLRACQEFCV
jgi:hypothetical protein